MGRTTQAEFDMFSGGGGHKIRHRLGGAAGGGDIIQKGTEKKPRTLRENLQVVERGREGESGTASGELSS